VHFVMLRPPIAVLRDRVAQSSRQATSKVSDPGTLDNILIAHELYSPIHPDDLIIDNSDIDPDDVARQIIGHLS